MGRGVNQRQAIAATKPKELLYGSRPRGEKPRCPKPIYSAEWYAKRISQRCQEVPFYDRAIARVELSFLASDFPSKVAPVEREWLDLYEGKPQLVGDEVWKLESYWTEKPETGVIGIVVIHKNGSGTTYRLPRWKAKPQSNYPLDEFINYSERREIIEQMLQESKWCSQWSRSIDKLDGLDKHDLFSRIDFISSLAPVHFVPSSDPGRVRLNLTIEDEVTRDVAQDIHDLVEAHPTVLFHAE